jgi:hypothetical protein
MIADLKSTRHKTPRLTVEGGLVQRSPNRVRSYFRNETTRYAA